MRFSQQPSKLYPNAYYFLLLSPSVGNVVPAQVNAYRTLFACDKTDAARVFVVSLYLSLWRTFEATVSIIAPVCFPVLDWAISEADSDFAMSDELLLPNVLAAKLATFGEVCLVLFDMIFTYSKLK